MRPPAGRRLRSGTSAPATNTERGTASIPACPPRPATARSRSRGTHGHHRHQTSTHTSRPRTSRHSRGSWTRSGLTSRSHAVSVTPATSAAQFNCSARWRSAEGPSCSRAATRWRGASGRPCSAPPRSSRTWNSGHNIIHGQWDWMNDPEIHSTEWEWDTTSPSEHWKKSHNFIHHKYTNVVGLDDDIGYGIMRLTRDQRWEKWMIGNPIIQPDYSERCSNGESRPTVWRRRSSARARSPWPRCAKTCRSSARRSASRSARTTSCSPRWRDATGSTRWAPMRSPT